MEAVPINVQSVRAKASLLKRSTENEEIRELAESVEHLAAVVGQLVSRLRDDDVQRKGTEAKKPSRSGMAGF